MTRKMLVGRRIAMLLAVFVAVLSVAPSAAADNARLNNIEGANVYTVR